MKAYTIALLGTLAALGGAGCSDDSAYWQDHYRKQFEEQKGALEARVTGAVEQRERAACDGRLTELRQQLAPREASTAGSGATGGEGEAAVTYQYPDANQPMHALLTSLMGERYDALNDQSGWETIGAPSDLYIGNQKTCARRQPETHPVRQAADGGAPPVCLIGLALRYNRRDNTFNVDYTRSGTDPTGVSFEGTGQRLRWEDITAVTKYAGEGEGRSEIRLTPADASAQYHPIFDTQLGRLQSEADRALAELMRPPTVE